MFNARVVRASLVIGALWGIFGLAAGIAIEVYLSWLGGGLEAGEGSHLRVPFIFLVWGVASGILFSAFLALFEKPRPSGVPPWYRALAWGICGALPLPALLPLVYQDAEFGVRDAVILGAAVLVAGSSAATTTLWLARKGRSNDAAA
jgi:hypothetical protein